MRMLKSLVAGFGVVILAAPVTAQVPKTFDGRPDFTGVWSNASVTAMTRPASQKSLVVTEEEATHIAAGVPMAGITEEGFKGATYSDPSKGAPPKGDKAFGVLAYDSYWMDPGTKLAFVKGEWRTSFIVDPPDGQLPLVDPAAWAKKRKDFGEDYATGDVDYAGPEVPTIAERCLVFNSRAGPGMMSATYNNNYQFVQTPEYMMILVEQAHDARIVPIFATAEKARDSHKPSAIKPWMGDTVGWWDGDTFVMETINVHPLQAEGHTFPLSPKAVITERFTRTSDTDIFYDFVVNDPENFTKPWKAELSFYPSSRLYEYACLEGNYSMFNLLSGARAIERRAVATKSGKSKTANVAD